MENIVIPDAKMPARRFAVYGCTEQGLNVAKFLHDSLWFDNIVFLDEDFGDDSFQGFPVISLFDISDPNHTELFVVSEISNAFTLNYMKKLEFHNVAVGEDALTRLQDMTQLYSALMSGQFFDVVPHNTLPRNCNPRFTKFMVAETSRWDGLKVVDIGARGGVNKRWEDFNSKDLKIIGFEPNEHECKMLNEHYPGFVHSDVRFEGQMIFFPVALWSKAEQKVFHDVLFPAGSGLFAFKQDFFLERFSGKGHLQEQAQIPVACVSFKDFTRQFHVDDAWDFVKVDVEGAELDALIGFEDCLDDVLGIETEFILNGELRGSPTFRDTDAYLTSRGFTLYDMWIQRYPRLTLSYDKPVTPEFAQEISRRQIMTCAPNERNAGQVLTGDAIYFRDPIPDLKNANEHGVPDFWTKSRLIRLMCLFESYQLNDSAIEILEYASCFSPEEKECYRNLLVPPLSDGRYLGYSDYMRAHELQWHLMSGTRIA